MLRAARATADNVTLADPLMEQFVHIKGSRYRPGTFFNTVPLTLVSSAGEHLDFNEVFDCVVMLNVLEHTWSAIHVLQNMHNAVRRGGILVFNERTYDNKWDMFWKGAGNITTRSKNPPFWDVAHPINLRRAVIDVLLQYYTPLYLRRFSMEDDYPADEGIYFIGVRM